MRKRIVEFDSEKDEWYYQPKIYLNPKSADPLYSETIEFKSSLSRDMSKKFLDDLDSFLEEEGESKTGSSGKRKNNNSGFGKPLKNNGKLRRPVISFFSEKAATIEAEIRKINQDMEIRKKIHKECQCKIKKDRKEIERWLKEISLYSPGTRHSIDLRRQDLERTLISLSKEQRFTKLNLWRDLVSLRRELRELTLELSALKRIAELVENGGGDDISK